MKLQTGGAGTEAYGRGLGSGTERAERAERAERTDRAERAEGRRNVQSPPMDVAGDRQTSGNSAQLHGFISNRIRYRPTPSDAFKQNLKSGNSPSLCSLGTSHSQTDGKISSGSSSVHDRKDAVLRELYRSGVKAPLLSDIQRTVSPACLLSPDFAYAEPYFNAWILGSKGEATIQLDSPPSRKVTPGKKIRPDNNNNNNNNDNSNNNKKQRRIGKKTTLKMLKASSQETEPRAASAIVPCGGGGVGSGGVSSFRAASRSAHPSSSSAFPSSSSSPSPSSAHRSVLPSSHSPAGYIPLRSPGDVSRSSASSPVSRGVRFGGATTTEFNPDEVFEDDDYEVEEEEEFDVSEESEDIIREMNLFPYQWRTGAEKGSDPIPAPDVMYRTTYGTKLHDVLPISYEDFAPRQRRGAKSTPAQRRDSAKSARDFEFGVGTKSVADFRAKVESAGEFDERNDKKTMKIPLKKLMDTQIAQESIHQNEGKEEANDQRNKLAGRNGSLFSKLQLATYHVKRANAVAAFKNRNRSKLSSFPARGMSRQGSRDKRTSGRDKTGAKDRPLKRESVKYHPGDIPVRIVCSPPSTAQTGSPIKRPAPRATPSVIASSPTETAPLTGKNLSPTPAIDAETVGAVLKKVEKSGVEFSASKEFEEASRRHNSARSSESYLRYVASKKPEVESTTTRTTTTKTMPTSTIAAQQSQKHDGPLGVGRSNSPASTKDNAELMMLLKDGDNLELMTQQRLAIDVVSDSDTSMKKTSPATPVPTPAAPTTPLPTAAHAQLFLVSGARSAEEISSLRINQFEPRFNRSAGGRVRGSLRGGAGSLLGRQPQQQQPHHHLQQHHRRPDSRHRDSNLWVKKQINVVFFDKEEPIGEA